LAFAAMVAFGEFPSCVEPGRGGLALPEFYLERAIAAFDLSKPLHYQLTLPHGSLAHTNQLT